jgi:hypothetical protein
MKTVVAACFILWERIAIYGKEGYKLDFSKWTGTLQKKLQPPVMLLTIEMITSKLSLWNSYLRGIESIGKEENYSEEERSD